MFSLTYEVKFNEETTEYKSFFINKEICYNKITKIFILRHFYHWSQYTNTVKICIEGDFPIYLCTKRLNKTQESKIIKMLESKTGMKAKLIEDLKAFLLY